MHRFALAITLALSAATAAFAQTPPPASAFGRLPAIQDADISPDGQRIAILGGAPARRTVTIATVDSLQLQTLDLGDVESWTVGWATNDRAIIRISFWKDLALRQSYQFTRNVVIDQNAKAISELLGGDGPQGYGLGHPVIGITDGPDASAMVLAPSSDAYVALWRVDLKSGRGKVEEQGALDTVFWGIDKQGHARVREDISSGTHTWRLLGRAKGATAWKVVLESKKEEDERRFFGYSDAYDAVYLSDASSDREMIIVRRNLADGSTEQVATAPDDADLLWDPYLDKPVGIQSGFGLPNTQWLDPELKAISDGLTKVLGAAPDFGGWSKDRTRFLVRVATPDQPAQWHLYDKARHELSPVGEEYPELKGARLGKTSIITYRARDGLKIPAYLTLPPGASTSQKLPLVVLPHAALGGRNAYDFDWLAQFIASRGYAVLRPQFRGSTGFGKAFEEAGRKEWGGKVQTDFLDGIAYLAEQGTVDASRACIVGWSFGGYAALAGATLHPEAYRCAAAINGVSDLPTFMGEIVQRQGRDSRGMRYWQQMMGDSIADGPLLVATSPARQVTAETPPVLLVVSDQDTSVKPAQSARMRTALEAAGRPVTYIVLKNEDDYLMTSANRTKMLESLGDFLAANLPVSP
jgi:dipeptidyl aminopeptidase/acylaminoacyl peptidase